MKETDHINFERDTDICRTRKCKFDWKDTLCHCGHVESIPEMTWSLHQSRSFASMAVRRFETSTSKHRLTKCLQPGSKEVAFFFGEGGLFDANIYIYTYIYINILFPRNIGF